MDNKIRERINNIKDGATRIEFNEERFLGLPCERCGLQAVVLTDSDLGWELVCYRCENVIGVMEWGGSEVRPTPLDTTLGGHPVPCEACGTQIAEHC